MCRMPKFNRVGDYTGPVAMAPSFKLIAPLAVTGVPWKVEVVVFFVWQICALPLRVVVLPTVDVVDG